MRDLSGGAARVTDKMPENFLFLGLAALLFPGARVIHCRRDPLDTCLSCYFQQFSHGHAFTNDLSSLAAYYRDYRRLMDHWRAVLPLPTLDVRYEDLVVDQETVSRRIVSFCRLEWRRACLEFYRSERPVHTTSAAQVRQPIYATSIRRWRRYERHPGPLREGLAERA